MRTSVDFPDPLFRHLKARAALEGKSLRELVLTLIEKGLAQPEGPAADSAPVPLPSVRLGAPMKLKAGELSNAKLAEFLRD